MYCVSKVSYRIFCQGETQQHGPRGCSPQTLKGIYAIVQVLSPFFDTIYKRVSEIPGGNPRAPPETLVSIVFFIASMGYGI